jgi:hypothetical protein
LIDRQFLLAASTEPRQRTKHIAVPSVKTKLAVSHTAWTARTLLLDRANDRPWTRSGPEPLALEPIATPGSEDERDGSCVPPEAPAKARVIERARFHLCRFKNFSLARLELFFSDNALTMKQKNLVEDADSTQNVPDMRSTHCRKSTFAKPPGCSAQIRKKAKPVQFPDSAGLLTSVSRRERTQGLEGQPGLEGADSARREVRAAGGSHGFLLIVPGVGTVHVAGCRTVSGPGPSGRSG